MELRESAEDYLEKILMLNQSMGQVRSVDLANEMNFSKPSISIAMKKLKQNGFVNIDGGGYITLTESGMEIASRVLERHTLLTALLMALGVEEATAKEDACRIEHDLSVESFEKIKAYCHKQNLLD
ncbi:MAG: metal-dependent transcriptional regulator [Clostridiales bacterium]|nr:metal-dependent transcriptional regulator [Clostridiales bacterium]